MIANNVWSNKQAGVSLIELLLIIAILIVTCSKSLPLVKPYLANRALKSAAENLAGDISSMRYRALVDSTKYRVKFNVDANSYEIWQCESSGAICNDCTNLIDTKSPAAFRKDINLIAVAFAGDDGSMITFQNRVRPPQATLCSKMD